MNRTSEHTDLVKRVHLAVGSLPEIRAWVRNVGLATPVHCDHPIFYGVRGEADIDALIAPFARRLAIECKTGSGKLEKDQIKYRDMILRFGGYHYVARDVEKTLQTVKEWIAFEARRK